MRFSDRICIVTGGASGIGLATCRRMCDEGGMVALVDRDEEKGRRQAEEIGGDCTFFRCDLSSSGEIERCVKEILGKWGRVDVLVNDAAMMTFEPITELPLEKWELVQSVNMTAVFLLSKACIPHMKGGAIVNVSSVHAHETTANVVPYATSKGAMEAFARAVSQEYPASQLRINCVAPGAIDTPMLWSNPNVKSGREKIQGAVGKPEDVAAAICFLASDEAAFINGTTLVVDGGRLDTL